MTASASVRLSRLRGSISQLGRGNAHQKKVPQAFFGGAGISERRWGNGVPDFSG